MGSEIVASTMKAFFETEGVCIYHGDCRQILRVLPDGCCDLVVTDPPYLVGYDGRWGSDVTPCKGDLESSWLAPAFVEIWRVLKENSFCLSFYGWPHADLFLGTWKLIGFRPVSQIVCVKDNIGLGHYTRNQHEIAFLLAKGHPAKPASPTSDVFSWERETTLYHPNQKPVRTISRIIAAYSHEGALILDPFMGSGTTLLAARNLGRRAIGIEIEADYCRIAAERLAQQILQFEEQPKPPPEQSWLPLLIPLSHPKANEASREAE